MLVPILLKYENMLVLIIPKGGKWCFYLLCQRRNHLQVFSTSCWPQLAKMSPTFAFTWLRFTWSILLRQALGVDGRGIFKNIKIVLPCHLHSCFATLSQPLDELIVTWEGKTCKSRTFSAFFQRTAMSMGATMAARVEAIGHTLPQVQAFLCLTALLALFGKCINKTHPGLSLLVLWVSRLVWIVGYWGRDTLTEHINYSSGLPGPSEEKRKGKQHCNMNGYEGGRYLYYRKYSVQSACPCLLLPEVGSSRSGLKDPK